MQQAENSAAFVDAKDRKYFGIVHHSFAIIIHFTPTFPLLQPDIKDKKHFLNNEKTLVILYQSIIFTGQICFNTRKYHEETLLISLFLGSCATLPAQKTSEFPTVYQSLSITEMY